MVELALLCNVAISISSKKVRVLGEVASNRNSAVSDFKDSA